MAGILKVDRVQSDSNLAFNIAGSNVAFMDASTLRMVGSNVSLAGTNVFTNGKLVTSAQPTGAVLQAVSATTTTQTSTTSTSFVTGNLSASITPTSSSSKVLVLLGINGVYLSAVPNNCVVALYRGGSALFTFGQVYSGGSTAYSGLPLSYLDSPATTSSTTYAIYFKSAGGSSVALQQDSTYSTITLLEIAA